MAEDWYYTAGGGQNGPMEWAELQRLASDGTLSPADLVWHAALPQWVAASEVQGLFTAGVADKPAEIPIAAVAPPAASVLEYSTGEPNKAEPTGEIIYAGFFLRFLAYLVDGVILLAILIPVVMGFMFLIGVLDSLSMNGFLYAIRTMDTNPLAGLVLRLVIGGVAWLYFAYQESSAAQATLGKRLMGLVVTDTQGRRISLLRASGRHFAKIISGLILWIGYIMAGLTQRKQALHDMMSGCLVVLKPN